MSSSTATHHNKPAAASSAPPAATPTPLSAATNPHAAERTKVVVRNLPPTLSLDGFRAVLDKHAAPNSIGWLQYIPGKVRCVRQFARLCWRASCTQPPAHNTNQPTNQPVATHTHTPPRARTRAA
jgi:hypothetical protein